MRFLFQIQQRLADIVSNNVVSNNVLHNSLAASPVCRARRFFGLTIPLIFVASSLSVAAETPITLLRNQTRDTLQKEAVLKNGDKKDQALTALCDLYVVLRKDDRYGESEMLQQDAAKIRRRLIRSAKLRSDKLKRNDVARPDGLTSKVDSAIKQAIVDADENSDSDRSSDSDKAVASNKKPGLGGNAGAAAFDSGWELVELMQRIVAPDFWETNGGPGAIHYFAMRRVLVVRATSDIHEQIRDLLKSLPR